MGRKYWRSEYIYEYSTQDRLIKAVCGELVWGVWTDQTIYQILARSVLITQIMKAADTSQTSVNVYLMKHPRRQPILFPRRLEDQKSYRHMRCLHRSVYRRLPKRWQHCTKPHRVRNQRPWWHIYLHKNLKSTSNIPCNFSLFKGCIECRGHMTRIKKWWNCVLFAEFHWTKTERFVFWMRFCSSYLLCRSYPRDLSKQILMRMKWKIHVICPELFLTTRILQWTWNWFWLVLCVPIAWRWWIGLLCRYLSISINSRRD